MRVRLSSSPSCESQNPGFPVLRPVLVAEPDQYQLGQNCRYAKLTPSTSEGNRHNAPSEEEPNRRVE
jgi:hypothetical protein